MSAAEGVGVSDDDFALEAALAQIEAAGQTLEFLIEDSEPADRQLPNFGVAISFVTHHLLLHQREAYDAYEALIQRRKEAA
jgi:hypothetical protein